METVNDDPPPAPPPPPPPEDRPRLTRATDDKVLSGLCGGLGRYFGVDPLVFRIGFVVLALAGGSGVLLYLVGWVLVPDDTGRNAGASRLGREREQKLLAAVLAGVGLVLLLDRMTGHGGSDVPVGLALVAIGVLVLWSRRDGGGPPPPPSGPPTSPSTLSGTDPAPPPAPPVPPAQPAAAVGPPRPRSVLVPVTLSLLLILAGGLAMAGVSALTALAVLLLVTGGALIVGATRGRARWLIPVGLALSVALLGASAVDDIPIRGGAGERFHRPASLVEVRSPYRLSAGELTVDLGDLDVAGGTTRVVASVGVGKLVVLVPDDVALDVEGSVGLGELQLLGRTWGGADRAEQAVTTGPEGAGRLEVDASVGLGALEVHRAAA